MVLQQSASTHTRTSIPPFFLLRVCMCYTSWVIRGEIQGLKISWGSQRWWEGRNAVMHRATILCLHYPRDRTANAKQGQEQTPGLQWKLSSVCMDKKCRLWWRCNLIIHVCVWWAASISPEEASVCVTTRKCRCNISSLWIFTVTFGKNSKEELSSLIATCLSLWVAVCMQTLPWNSNSSSIQHPSFGLSVHIDSTHRHTITVWPVVYLPLVYTHAAFDWHAM